MKPGYILNPVIMDHYFTIDRASSAEFKDRGSKFIAFAYPVENAAIFKAHLQALKKEHSKAVHHCFAYRLGITGNDFRLNDDGEPSGTAGRPILGQIDSKKVTNAGIIVVRYFGGTLLGVPGLINAYKTVAALVLQTLPAIKRQIEIPYTLEFAYNSLNEVMQIIKQYNCNIIEQEIGLFSRIKLSIPRQRVEEILYRLKESRNIDVKAIV